MNDTEFNKFIGGAIVRLFVISSTFDPYDYENPIHYFMDDAYYRLIPDFSIMADMFLRKSYLTLNDGILGLFSDTKEEYFYQMSRSNSKL